MLPPVSLIWITLASRLIVASAIPHKGSVLADAERAAVEIARNITTKENKSLLLIVTTTRSADAAQRDAIRGTWGAQTAQHHIQLLFVFTDLKSEERTAITREAANHPDILILDALPHEFENDMVLALNALHWALDAYPETQYLGKVTADVWLNVPRLAGILATTDATDTNWILGRYEDGQSAEVKDVYGGLHAFKQLGKGRFALGHLWLMPRRTLRRVIQTAQRVPPSTDIGDAVITGDYRRRLHLDERHRADVVNMWDVDEGVCYRERYLLVHGAFYDQQSQIHNQNCH